ncbi:MAG: hypothetical protein KGL39_19980 [Patescibacteria group bacterium]|nr:hypothetical protein [Patescibacteria group bacterium]
MRPNLTDEEKRLAWETGELGYTYRNVQKFARKAWLESLKQSLKFYLEANRRFGKSSFFLRVLSEGRIKRPKSKAGFYAPVKEGLRDYVIPIIEETFEDCPEELRPVLDAHLTLNFPNGSSIIFRGSNNQQHRVRRGNDLEEAIIDEARDVDNLQTLIDSVVIPSLFKSGGHLLIGSTPADTEDHDLKAIHDAAEREGWMHHCDIYECNKHDSEDFPLARIEQWKRETKDATAWDREYMTKWVTDPTKTIIPEWSDDYARRVERDEFFPYYHKYAGLDTGVRDKTVGVFGFYDFKRAALIVESEFVLVDSGVRTDRIAELTKENERLLGYQSVHHPDPKFPNLSDYERMRLRVADNNNLILVNDLDAKYGLNFFPTHKDELAAMINELRLWVKAGRILVNPVCKELIGCLKNGIWDKNKKELARSKTYGHFDALMALVYLVRNIDTQTNPIPTWHGKNYTTHAMPIKPNVSPTAQHVLAQAFKIKSPLQDARNDFIRGRL